MGIAVAAIATVAVAIAAVVGGHGLRGDPVQGVDGAGITTLRGSFDRFTGAPGDAACPSCVSGYIRDGGRSVFVVLPGNCTVPPGDRTVTVKGRFAADLGKQSYRATTCATTG